VDSAGWLDGCSNFWIICLESSKRGVLEVAKTLAHYETTFGTFHCKLSPVLFPTRWSGGNTYQIDPHLPI
jgi:hypothetical protein